MIALIWNRIKDMGAHGSPKGMEEIFSDPEILTLLKDKEVLKAYSDILEHPENLAKHMTNENVRKLLDKMRKFKGFPQPEDASKIFKHGQAVSSLFIFVCRFLPFFMIW